MANQSTEEEVFEFSNTEFTQEDLINALNEMVYEYRKLSQTFEEIKVEDKSLKNSSVESSPPHLEDTDSLKTELSRLMMENESLRLRSFELESEKKPANDRTGLGFTTGESCSGETCTQSNLVYDKFKKMNFVKASVIYNTYESVRYDDQTSGQLNQKGNSVGYIRLENMKSSWLKNRLDKEKAKFGSNSFVQNQQRCGSKKVKSEWRKVQPRRDLNGQNTKPKLNRSHHISAHTLMDFHTEKTVKDNRYKDVDELSGLKPRPAVKPGFPESNTTRKTTKPHRDMGSNPSTESDYKTAVNSKNKMQMLCKRKETIAQRDLQLNMWPHHSAHRGNESAESPLALVSWKLKQKANTKISTTIRKFYLNDATHGQRQQLRDLALVNNILQEWYRKEELLERSPTLPQTSPSLP
ncbi:callose synthase 1-like [Dorcoceras hygrometricum]|uniref:Callose synthase 1-like n=1 Tax=Dorcoceras hygrometricum TaxID=472368 RepID=A0A2Z7D549_9LAMI|nr:callose synthase 1-like [Dorcoceras hygrometricum]